MTYQATWINKLEQFGFVDITLLLEDDEKIRPPVRVNKNFHTKEVEVDDKFLEEEAQREIDKAIYEQDNKDKLLEAEASELRNQAAALVEQAEQKEKEAEEIKNPKAEVAEVEVVP